jgi:hypothetical protein
MPRNPEQNDRRVTDSRNIVDTLAEAYNLEGGGQRIAVQQGLVVPSSDPLQGGWLQAEHITAEITDTVTAGGSILRLFPEDWARESGYLCRVLGTNIRLDGQGGGSADAEPSLQWVMAGPGTQTQLSLAFYRVVLPNDDIANWYNSEHVDGGTLARVDNVMVGKVIPSASFAYLSVSNTRTGSQDIDAELDVSYLRVPKNTQIPT